MNRPSQRAPLVLSCEGTSSSRRWHPRLSRKIHLPGSADSKRLTPPSQTLYFQHFPACLGSADSKALTLAKILPQVLCFPHLARPLATAENKRLITPVESALTKSPSATPLESALTKNGGEGFAHTARSVPPHSNLPISKLSTLALSLLFSVHCALLQKLNLPQVLWNLCLARSFAKHPPVRRGCLRLRRRYWS